MANQYITDPDLLRQLNAPEPQGGGYVSDPALLAELNRAPTTSHSAGILSGIRESLLDAPAQLLERGVKAVAPGLADWMEEKAASTGLTAGKLTAQQATENARGSTANFFGADAPSAGGRLAGNVIGAVAAPAAMARMGVTSLLPQALARSPYAAAAAEGAAMVPLSQTVDDPNPDNFWKEKLKQTGAGAVGGVAGRAIGQGVSRALAPAAIRPEAQLLQREGVQLTPGQQLGGRFATTEGKLTSVPIIGGAIEKSYAGGIEDFNRALYNRVLAPINEKFSGAVPVGREAVKELKDKLGGAYDDVLERVNFRPDDGFRNATARLYAQADSALPPEAVRIVEKQLAGIDRKLTAGSGALDGEALKAIDSELARVARTYRDSANGAERELARALNELRSELRAGLARVNPQEAARLSDINSGYALYARIRDAAGRAGALEGIVTPTTLGQAVRAGATKTQRATGGAPLQDIADAAKLVLRNRVPDSGTPGRTMLPWLTAAALSGEPISLKVLLGGALGSLPYRYPQFTNAMLTRGRPAAATRQALASGIQAAGAPVAGATLRDDEDELLRRALAR